ncbi:conserved hypothetical integral membrane protein [Ruaniaceae bacterium KH17]|nr:conserved hypothetical integral membrane protein [Ruaniaceae bacterium KH17]
MTPDGHERHTDPVQLTPLTTLPGRIADRTLEVRHGVFLCAVIALVSTAIGRVVPIVGSAIPAVVIGVVVGLVIKPDTRFRPGITYSSRFLLQLAVAVLGSQLSLRSIVEVGVESLPVMLTSLTMCLVVAWLLGRALGVDRELRTLIGVGTGICGASAIAAVSPVIKARNASISYAISTVFLFNLIAVLVFPFVGHALGMTPHAFGLFAGTAVNDTSSVVAAASVFSAAALGFAVVVKLVRTLMIIPITIGLAAMEARREGADGGRVSISRLIPWFLIGFLVMAALVSAGVFSDFAVAALREVSIFLIATALAAIGLSTNLGAIRSAGLKPLALGGVLSLTVACTTLGMMKLTGQF